MMNTQTPRDIAKTALIEALKNNGGDTKNEKVVEAIEKLVSFNPESAPTENSKLLEGNWLLINAPNFPDRQPDPQNRYIYTLGRLAFNMFESVELKVEDEPTITFNIYGATDMDVWDEQNIRYRSSNREKSFYDEKVSARKSKSALLGRRFANY